MLGCVQIALDPEAISVAPAVYIPRCWNWPANLSTPACGDSNTRRFGGCCTALRVALTEMVRESQRVVGDAQPVYAP